MSSLPIETKVLMKRYNIYPNKRLGQNFLIDRTVLESIADAGEISKDDLVIEIGPGLGVLTSELCRRAGKVIAIELDRKFIDILKDVLKEYNNYEIVQGDILKTDIDNLTENWDGNIKVISNLPYYITTPVIMKILEENNRVKTIVVMIQKEVAERIVAKPGNKEYGALTVAVQYYGTAKKMFDVPSHCFIPKPEVTSSVIRIDADKNMSIEISSKENFFKVVRASFSHRRKTILNCLVGSGLFNQKSKEEIVQKLKKINLDEKQRPETLSIFDFAKISEEIYTRGKQNDKE